MQLYLKKETFVKLVNSVFIGTVGTFKYAIGKLCNADVPENT